MLLNLLLVVTAASSALAYYSGEFIPKSYYIIDHDGHKSEVVYFRSKRDVELFPLLRLKRGGGSQASASAHSSASASSSSNSGGGGGYYPDNLGYDPGYYGGGGTGGGHSQSFASASSSSSAGVPGSGYGHGGSGIGGVGGTGGYNGPILFSRFGEEAGSGIKVSGSAQGPSGAFSSTSSSSKDGKVTYSVQSGKY